MNDTRKPMNCTGLFGKRCTCGLFHSGPDTDRPSMLASRLFWLGAVASGLLWGLVGLLL